MPSGPKKRARERRKKHGSPTATDANSDRETEALSISGSMDVDDLELDTPGKASVRPSFLDREMLSSQTDEWVRVSNFDVGTPTSQTGENEPSAEDVDGSSSRRSLDRLAEWETVSGENIPERQEGSINSLEEEPLEVEAVSGHSSEGYMHLPSPHPAEGDKVGDSWDSDRIDRSKKNRSRSSSSSSSFEEKPAPTSAETGDGVSSAPHLSPVASAGEGDIEEIKRSNEDSVEKEVVHQPAPETEVGVVSDEATSTAEKTEDAAAASDDPVVVGEEKKVEEHQKGQANGVASSLAATSPDEEIFSSSAAKDISEVDSPLTIPAPEEEPPHEDKEVLPIAEESRTQEDFAGEKMKSFTSILEIDPDENEKTTSAATVEDNPDDESDKSFVSLIKIGPDGNEKTSTVEDNPDENDKSFTSILKSTPEENETLFASTDQSTPGDENEKSFTSVDKCSSGNDEAAASSPEDVEDKEVNTDEKVVSPTIGDSAASDENEKEVASTSAEAEVEKINGNVPDFVLVEKNSSDPKELGAHSGSEKALPTSGTAEPGALAEERHLAVPAASGEKNGIANPLLESKSFTGCWGPIYWILGLLGCDH